MGFVSIPAAPPQGGGRMCAELVLDDAELRAALALLKGALAELTRGVPNGVDPTPAPRAAAPPAPAPVQPPQPAPQPASPAPAPVPRPVVPQAQPLAQPLAQQMAQLHVAPQPAAPPQQSWQAPPAAQPPPPPPPRPQPPLPQPAFYSSPPAYPPPSQPQPPPPAAYIAPPPPPPLVQQQAAPPPPQQQQAAGARLGPTVSGHPIAASPNWTLTWQTDPEEHAGRAVSALAYARSLPGLPGGDGHPGWLLSCSKGFINLWETGRAGAGDEMALLCMHSAQVDVSITKLVLEPETKLLFGAAVSNADGSECITVNNLDPEVTGQMALLAQRYKFAPPPDRPRATQRLMQQVVSLHGLTPGLRSSAMVAYGDRLLMFAAQPTVRAGSVLHDPAFHFIAHAGSVITALHRPTGIDGCCALVSGAQDGKVHLWDLKQPPKSNMPAAKLYRHTKAVTGLAMVSDDRLVSSSMDGTVLLWDLRTTRGPLFSNAAPGGAPVLRIAAGPWGDQLAVATAKGLHSVELFDFDAPMANVATWPLDRPYADLAFNAVTHDLYAACPSGAVHVYARRA